MEYSGPKLALFKYATWRGWSSTAHCSWRCLSPGARTWRSLVLAAVWVKVLVLVLVVTLVAATHARYRIDQAIRYFAGLLARR